MTNVSSSDDGYDQLINTFIHILNALFSSKSINTPLPGTSLTKVFRMSSINRINSILYTILVLTTVR